MTDPLRSVLSGKRLKSFIVNGITDMEHEWVAHAAKLNCISTREWIVRAINDRLRHQGVDAVLLAERCDHDF